MQGHKALLRARPAPNHLNPEMAHLKPVLDLFRRTPRAAFRKAGQQRNAAAACNDGENHCTQGSLCVWDPVFPSRGGVLN